MLFCFCFAINVGNTVDIVVCTGNFRRLRIFDDSDVWQAVQTLLKDSISLKLRSKFKDCNMFYDTCEVNRSLDSGITAANYGNIFSFKQWTVTIDRKSTRLNSSHVS